MKHLNFTQIPSGYLSIHTASNLALNGDQWKVTNKVLYINYVDIMYAMST